MIAFDTNVVVRLLVGDEPEQYEKVLAAIRQAELEEETIFLAGVVLCETAWVLTKSYGVPRREIADALELLARDDRFTVERVSLVLTAVHRFAEGRGDFADYLIGEIARAEGARTTATFDRALRREPGFGLL